MIRGYRNIPISVATKVRDDLVENLDWYSKNPTTSIAKTNLEFSLKNTSTIREVFFNCSDHLYPITSFVFIQVPDRSVIEGIKTVLFLHVDDSEINQRPINWSEVCLAATLEFRQTRIPVYLIKNSQVIPVLSVSLKENKLTLYSDSERGGV